MTLEPKPDPTDPSPPDTERPDAPTAEASAETPAQAQASAAPDVASDEPSLAAASSAPEPAPAPPTATQDLPVAAAAAAPAAVAPAPQPAPAPTEEGLSPVVKTLLAVAFACFVLGGLIFGYLFYTTVRDVTAYYNLPAPVVAQPLPAQGPAGRPAAPGAPTPTIAPPPPQAPAPNLSAAPVWDRKGRVNILLMGTDEGRTCDDGLPRSDTMILVSIDPEAKRAYMISFPRDLWVAIPGRGIAGIPNEDRINTALVWGDLYRYPGGGPMLARATVEKNFGQPINYHAIINIDGLARVIDILGGVDIDVKNEVHDFNYPTADCGVKTIDIKPGMQHMDGERALEFARSRHESSDLDRADRQQQVLLAIRQKALQLDIIPKLPALLGEYKNLVKTDLSPIEILALANLMKDIKSDSIERQVIDINMIHPWTRPDGAQVLIPDRAKIRAVFEKMFNTPSAASN
ncbi:MAG: LCP family protein [Anaerolineae bacterium]